MKIRVLGRIIFFVALMICCFSFIAFADASINIYVDNELVEFDVKPVIENGRTLVPLRGVFERLGAVVDWNKGISEVIIKDSYNEIEMLLGKNKVMVNGEIKSIDVPTRMINSRTFAPLRFISENLGHTVKWDKATSSVYITKNNAAKKNNNLILSVNSKEDLIALLEYNSKLYNYMWQERVAVDMEAVFDKTTELPQTEAQAPTSSSTNDSSDTNNQVEGVQEGDIIKNDGKYIYYNSGNSVIIIDANPKSPKIITTVNIPENTNISEIFVSDNKLVIIGQNNYFYIMYDQPSKTNSDEINKKTDAMIFPPKFHEDRTNVLVYNIKNIQKPMLEREYLFDGSYLSGRIVEGRLYLVNNKYINFNYSYYNLKNIEIPTPYFIDVLNNEKYEFNYDEIKYFPNYIDSRYMYTVGVDLTNNNSAPNVDVYLGGSDTIYVSKNNMYAAIADYSYDNTIAQAEIYNPTYTTSTVIYKFKLDNGKVKVASQNKVPGNIINQFSMDEYKDMFRIATTTGEVWQNTSKNNIYILDDNMDIVGTLLGLAEGEKIYSTRFAGDRIYMVTFKQIDPLFVIDASNPKKPFVEGMLKIPGYSTYLHIIDDNHILGFGYDTEENKWGGTINKGLKLSLFDVSDTKKPRELKSEIIGNAGTYSEVLYNHKALMFSLAKKLMAFPVSVASDNYTNTFTGAYIYEVNNVSFNYKYKINHINKDNYSYGYEIKRVIYIGDFIYSFSERLMQVHSISNNTKLGELIIKQ